MAQADIGLVGLAVMGQNLALNMANHGYTVAVYNRTVTKMEEFLTGPAQGKSIIGTYSPQELVQSLTQPRKIMLMVQAGPAVDAVIDQVLEFLEPGDLLIDGGNSYFKDTMRREKKLQEKGLLYLGVGVSGGEEGALLGPSIMPGGSREAWNLAGQVLTDIAAKVDGQPCCSYVGPDGAGHYVKMVHNGIEYGDMQLIAEVYFLLQELLGLDATEIGNIFDQWNSGELESYLVEITAKVLRYIDPETDGPLVDLILDSAGQKGTGRWASQEALDLGAPLSIITEAVFARFLSAQKEERLFAAQILEGPPFQYVEDRSHLIEDLKAALYAAKICSYAQGFMLLRVASEEYGWDLKLGNIALLWRGGCIIRAQFLNKINAAYNHNQQLPNLLLDPYFQGVLGQTQSSWRRVVSLAVLNGIPAPGLSAALAYYDSYRRDRLPANLIQAQRDFFGAHMYQRIDREGTFHTQWEERSGD